MKMNEYLSQVTDQIRCQKIHKDYLCPIHVIRAFIRHLQLFYMSNFLEFNFFAFFSPLSEFCGSR